MSKKLFSAATVLLLFILTVLSGCRKSSEHGLFTALNEPQPAENGSVSTDWITEDAESQTEPFVGIPDDYTLFHVISENINANEYQEQILITKEKNTLDSSIVLFIVHFDPLLNSYVISNRLKSKATAIENFNIQLADLTGNFNLELVCQGTNTAGETTLDVFTEQTGESEADLPVYKSILSLAVRGLIEIHYQDRIQPEYINKTANGTAFPVTAKKESSEINFTIEETYTWDEKEFMYKKTSENKVSDNIKDPASLRRIIGETADSFASMIDGAWKFAGSDTILFLNRKIMKIELYDYDSVESYTWTQTHKSLYNRFTIQGYNDYIKFIILSLRITVLTPNEILIDVYDVNSNSVTFKKNIPLSGKYTRLGNQEIFGQDGNKKFDIDWELTGTYISETNRRIMFSENKFTRYEGNASTTGYFSLYPLNKDDTVICLKTISPTFSVVKTENMLIRFTEIRKEGKINRSIELIPIQLNINGWNATGGESIRYEQIVDISEGQ